VQDENDQEDLKLLEAESVDELGDRWRARRLVRGRRLYIK
jgi:hypothetical protein